MSSTNSKTEGFAIVWKSLLAYGIWFILRNMFTKIPALSVNWYKLNDFFAELYIKLSATSLELLGYSLRYNSRNLILNGSSEMYVGNHCLGLSASFIFVFIILLLKGRFKYKLLFSLFGLLIIFLVNWFRIFGLALMLMHGSKRFFEFNHSYTYLVLVYGIIFMMIIFYENKLSKR